MPTIRPPRTIELQTNIVLESVPTCPHCGFAVQETMTTDAYLFFYECNNCKTLLRQNRDDCCAFSSFGSVKCPPIQQKHTGCGCRGNCQ